MKRMNQLFAPLFIGAAFLLGTSCEGPAGVAGIDANETCKKCHNPEVVEFVAAQYDLSKHSRGEAAFEEAGNATCAPCHEAEGFKYVCANNISSAFVKNETTGKFATGFVATDATAYGEFKCSMCHSSLHTSYDSTDFYPLTTTAPVAMTMWAGTKTIDLPQDGGNSNLCVKCHQPRPLGTSTTLSDGNVVDYASLVANPTAIFYDAEVGNAAPNKLVPGYRTHVHYGSVGAIFAGKGGLEFAGSLSYTNSAHSSIASCQDCHMAPVTGASGGHTFKAKGNYKGCNVAGCHESSPLNATAPKVADAKAAVKALLETLASRLTTNGVEILHRDSNAESNLWAGITKNNYDGYLNIYDPSTNPAGLIRNPAPSKSWTDAQKATNDGLTKLGSLKNVQMGAIINFQMCLREYSLGMHNYNYSKALLTNTLDALTAAGL
jgi:hypothetical protein